MSRAKATQAPALPGTIGELGPGDTATITLGGVDRRVRCSWQSAAGVNQWTFVRLWVVPVPGDGETHWGRPFSIASDTPIRDVRPFVAAVRTSADETQPVRDPVNASDASDSPLFGAST